MKARFVFACAAAGIGLMAFGATTASAEGDVGTFEISPGVVRQGDSVQLSATCADADMTVPAPIESGALVPTQMTGQQGEDGVWHLTGTTTVTWGVKPGNWSALFECGPGVVVADFVVEPGGEAPYAAIGIDDDVITPGQEVRVAASCQDPGFVRSGVFSPAVTAPDLVREEGDAVDSVLFSMGRIAADAKPGTYPISFLCVDREVTGEFTVVAGDAKKPAPVQAQVPVKPKGPADTGSLPVAAPGADDSGALVIGAGAAALVAAGGVGVWAYRRHRRA